jgi:sialic acid synthase
MGARIIEKHFTLHRAWKGSDQAFSLEPSGMARLVRDLKRMRLAMGDGVKRRLDIEVPALKKMGRVFNDEVVKAEAYSL